MISAFLQLARGWLALVPFALQAKLTADSFEDGMPPLYRKISLNGQPLRDPMPHKHPRTDNEPEQTYVDAMTLRLQHRTTDIFIPILRNGFALAVNRNVDGAAWTLAHGLSPAQRPDLPFGNCWVSGIAASVHLVERNGMASVRASVTDEEGTIHEFYAAAQPPERRYVPLPTTRSEQDWAQMQLTADSAGALVFRRKFGTVLVFRKEPSVSLMVKSGGSEERHLFFRLESVTDQFGSKIDYVFDDANAGLIPDEIAFGTHRVRIERNKSGCVERLIDPAGGDRLYEYRASTQPGGAPLMIATRAQVVGNTRSVTRYEYEEVEEGNAKDPVAYHCNISGISDPRGKTHEMQYGFDASRRGPGAFRCLMLSKLPERSGTARFFNYSHINSANDEARRITFVSDAEGHGRLYEFTENRVESCKAESGAAVLAQVAVHRRLTVSSFSGSEHEFSESEQIVRPTGKTTLVARESYEFEPEAGLMLKKAIDLSGNVMAFDYDEPLPHERPVVDALAPLAIRCGDPTGFTDALGGVTRFTYEPAFRQLAQTTDADGRIFLNVVSDPHAVLVSERVYADAQKWKSSEPFTQTDYEYADRENPGFATRKIVRTTAASPEKLAWEHDLVTEFAGNDLGEVVRKTVDPEGFSETTAFAYDENGNKRSVTYPNGYRIDFKYDAANRLTRIFRPVSGGGRSVKQLEYDLRGNKTKEIEPAGGSMLWNTTR